MEEDAHHQYLCICMYTCAHGVYETSAGKDGSLGSSYIIIRWRLLWVAVIFIPFKYCTNSSRIAYNVFWQDLSHTPCSKSSEIQCFSIRSTIAEISRFLTITSKRTRTATWSSYITFQYIPGIKVSIQWRCLQTHVYLGLLRTANSWTQPNHPAVEG